MIDAYIGAAFNRLQHGVYFALLALDLHRHAAVVLVAHPAGEPELMRRAIGSVAKADALYVAGKCVLESFFHLEYKDVIYFIRSQSAPVGQKDLIFLRGQCL